MVSHPNAGTDWKQKEKMKWLDGISDSVGMHQSKLWEIVKDREAWCAACSPRGRKQTWLSDWTTANTHSTAMKARESNFLRKKKTKIILLWYRIFRSWPSWGLDYSAFRMWGGKYLVLGIDISHCWWRVILMISILRNVHTSLAQTAPCNSYSTSD